MRMRVHHFDENSATPDRRIVHVGLAYQLHLDHADLGVGRRLGLPEDLLAYRHVEPVTGELRDDALLGLGAGPERLSPISECRIPSLCQLTAKYTALQS